MTDPIAGRLGRHLRALRLRENLDQRTLASRAGIALNAVKGLESGQGGTIRSLLRVLAALGRDAWIDTLAPEVSISPLEMLERRQPRQRASRPRRKRQS